MDTPLQWIEVFVLNPSLALLTIVFAALLLRESWEFRHKLEYRWLILLTLVWGVSYLSSYALRSIVLRESNAVGLYLVVSLLAVGLIRGRLYSVSVKRLHFVLVWLLAFSVTVLMLSILPFMARSAAMESAGLVVQLGSLSTLGMLLMVLPPRLRFHRNSA